MIKNCPVTIEDVNIAEKIWGPDISYLKGKTMRSKPTPTQKDEIKIPREIYNKHNKITLCIDTIYINGIRFLIAIAYPIYYCQCKPVENGSLDAYYEALNKIIRVLNMGGFTIDAIECNGEYKSLMDHICDGINI